MVIVYLIAVLYVVFGVQLAAAWYYDHHRAR
jgi:hypothetical protein